MGTFTERAILVILATGLGFALGYTKASSNARIAQQKAVSAQIEKNQVIVDDVIAKLNYAKMTNQNTIESLINENNRINDNANNCLISVERLRHAKSAVQYAKATRPAKTIGEHTSCADLSNYNLELIQSNINCQDKHKAILDWYYANGGE